MEKKIEKFLCEKHLLSLAVIHENTPYCCSCFYAYDLNLKNFIIASDKNSTHIQVISKNNAISGTIALDTKIIGKIKGIQFCGKIVKADENDSEIYFAKFPFSKTLNPTLWRIEISWIKFTDNTLGFGKKLIWKRD